MYIKYTYTVRVDDMVTNTLTYWRCIDWRVDIKLREYDIEVVSFETVEQEPKG